MRKLPVIFSALALAFAAQGAVPADPLDALVRDSPFLPSGAGHGSAPGISGPLEFRSVVFEHGEYAFSIYDQGSREAKWVKLGQQDLPFVAKSYDREQDILTVEYQGRTSALKLQPGHIAGQAPPGSVASPPPLPSAQDAARQAGNPSANSAQPSQSAAPATNNPSSQESQRLQQMADEIRRRRQLPVQQPKN